MLESEDNSKPKQGAIAVLLDGTFEEKQPDGQPAGTIGHAEMLEVRHEIATEPKRGSPENAGEVAGANLARIEIHPHAGRNHDEQNGEIERDVGRE